MSRASAVHVSIVHPATDVRIFTKQCRSLAEAGYDVTLYARTPEPEHRVDGVRVVPVPEPRSRVLRMTWGVARLLRPLLAERADVYHLHDPELVPLGLVLRLLTRRPVLFDAHEPLPDQIYDKHWIPDVLAPAVSRATRLLVRLTGRAVTAVVAASPPAAQAYAGARRLVTVGNYPIVLEGDDYDVPYPKRNRGLVYVGGITAGRGLTQMLEVARRVREQTGERLTLVGPFQPAGLEAELHTPGTADAVEYLGVLPPGEARRVMAEAKVGLILFQPSRAHRRAMPNKLFEYMASGVPVVGSDFPHWREIVDAAGGPDHPAGLLVPPDDVDAVERAVLALLNDPERAAAMGRFGRESATTRYTWSREAETLLSLYDDVLRAR